MVHLLRVFFNTEPDFLLLFKPPILRKLRTDSQKMSPGSWNLVIFHGQYIMKFHSETNLQVPLDVLIAYTQMHLAGSCITETTCADMYVIKTGHLVHLPNQQELRHRRRTKNRHFKVVVNNIQCFKGIIQLEVNYFSKLLTTYCSF